MHPGRRTDSDTVVDTGIDGMTLPDGRQLAWHVYGEPTGTPVLGFHGIAASHRQLRLARTAARDGAIRLLAVDRPGYGRSTFHPDRTLADAAADAASLADHLGIDRFGVTGVSAGGPSALAVAALLGERVTRASVVSCVGPRRQPAAKPGMLATARAAFEIARRRPDLNRRALAVFLSLARRRPGVAVRLRARCLPEVDRRVLRRSEMRMLYQDEFRNASPTAAHAAAQDLALLAGDWDFDVSDIEVPVRLHHGELDHEAPLDQGRQLEAAITGAELRCVPGAGHLAFADCLSYAVADAAGLQSWTAAP